MRSIFCLIALLFFTNVYSQSKKEVIENLQFQYDSLTGILNTERELSRSFILDLNSKLELSNQEFQKSNLKIESIKQENLKKDSEILILKQELVQIKADLLQLNTLYKETLLNLNNTALELKRIQDLSEVKNIPENKFEEFSKSFQKVNKDISAEITWINSSVYDNPKLTIRCEEYINDITSFFAGYSDLNEIDLQSKYGDKFDLNHSDFGQIFETGNCGWESKKITSTEYLGVLNDGDWFKITIKGGCEKNDYSNTIVRVIKVVKEGACFLMDNVISLSSE